ncbi:MAG: ABC transporter permease [Chloroflexi bacterium]|nr:ABC transporter permease [Chloroflexota bacterium]
MRVIDICLKDLAEMLGDRRILLFLVGMPLVFTLFMGFAYRSGTEGEAEVSLIELGWVDAGTEGALSHALYEMVSEMEGIHLVDLSQDTATAAKAAASGWRQVADEKVRSGSLNGVLLVAPGYSDRSADASPQSPVLITDQSTAEGRALVQAVRIPIARVASAAEIARLVASESGDTGWDISAFESALAAWGRAGSPGLVRLAAQEDTGEAWYGDNPYNMASPGILVMFAIMALVTSANVLLAERKAGTLARMATTSLTRWQILLGHALGMFAITLMQVLLLVVFGQVVLGVDYAREPLATLLISLALSLWVGGLGLTIGILANDDSQVVLFALLAMFILSALGGTWFPLDLVGGAFAAIGRASPSGQAMSGYQDILIRGSGLSAVWQPVGIMVAWALGFSALAWWLFRRIRV